MKRKVDYDRLRELWNAGVPAAQIALMMGVSESAIRKTKIKLGLPKHKRGFKGKLETDKEKRKWFVKSYPHFSDSTIALYLGYSQGSIPNLAKKMKLRKTEQYLGEANVVRARNIKKSYLKRSIDRSYLIRDPENGRFLKHK